MKIIKEGLRENPLVARITCKLCGAVLEITPEDCTHEENDLNFWIWCPCCETSITYHMRDVGPLFWLRINQKKTIISVPLDIEMKEQFEKACKSMGLNISDAINIFARKVVSGEANSILTKEELTTSPSNTGVEKALAVFEPASAEKVRKLQAKLRRNGNEEKPVMVDSSGQRNAISHLRGKEMGRATHNNLLDVITVEGEEE